MAIMEAGTAADVTQIGTARLEMTAAEAGGTAAGVTKWRLLEVGRQRI